MSRDSSNALLEQVPKFDELLYPTILALKALGGSGTIAEIVEQVIKLKKLPPNVVEVPDPTHENFTALEYRLAWVRTYLKRADAAVNSSRGVWSLTEKGAALTQEDCDEIPALVRKQGYASRKTKQKEKKSEDSPPAEDTEPDWKDELLETLLNLKPDAFESLAQRILRESGFIRVEVTGKSGDGGIDGIGILRVNLVSFTVLFQCKRYKGSVTPTIVRDFRGAMQGRSDKGLIITTGTFTSEAKKEATRDGAPTIDLIDGDSLCDLLKELRLGVAVEQVEKVAVDAVWFEQF